MILFICHVWMVDVSLRRRGNKLLGVFAVFFLRPRMPSGDWLVCVAGEAGWIDGTAAGPTQL